MNMPFPFFRPGDSLPDFQSGLVLLVDKPAGWTSFDVVNKIRARLRRITANRKIKVGHAGTLDPMATGLLILCTGRATKSISAFQDLPKQYEGSLLLGASTPSYDAETEPDAFFPWEHITPAMLENARKQFLGRIEQLPPMYSAVKVKGQPLYKLARKGKTIERKARAVEVYDFAFRQIELPELHFEVRCSKGTYIRSLAHDFGKILQSGAHLTALKRTAIGEHRLEEAWPLQDLVAVLESFGQGS